MFISETLIIFISLHHALLKASLQNTHVTMFRFFEKKFVQLTEFRFLAISLTDMGAILKVADFVDVLVNGEWKEGI